MSLALSIDVGGTKTLIGAVTREGVVQREWRQPTRVGGDDVSRVAEFAGTCAQEVSVTCVAAGFPEYVLADGTLTSDEVIAWNEQPHALLARTLAESGVSADRIVVGSDVGFGAIGESEFGAARNAPSMFYVSLGTGLSSSMVISGQVWAGARGEAIALGEWRADDGKLEQFASGAGMERRYARLTGERLDGPNISARAAAGDQAARTILESAGEALGSAIADAVAILDPHLVVLGGGLGSSPSVQRERILDTYRARVSRRPNAPEIRIAQLGSRSGLLGGAALAFRRCVAY